jgi:hypothetical protein
VRVLEGGGCGVGEGECFADGVWLVVGRLLGSGGAFLCPGSNFVLERPFRSANWECNWLILVKLGPN